VTDIAGATRDWISTTCQIPPLVVEFIDTAGLDDTLAPKGGIDRQAQKKTSELLSRCDLILFVIDASRPGPIQPIQTDKPLITILNKSDLATASSDDNTPFDTAHTVQISAKTGNGIDKLTGRIQTVLGVSNLDPTLPVCFTQRQELLLERLSAPNHAAQAKKLITELLFGSQNTQPANSYSEITEKSRNNA
ncbi:MAG: 50S ribosome-binding GTPase, partial [Planctomycetes bacterium]|nr:50S ribosome-binding GTPase [Planctomycetota bacterium]